MFTSRKLNLYSKTKYVNENHLDNGFTFSESRNSYDFMLSVS